MKNLREKLTKLWNEWEVRGLVILSLLLQIILIIFGSRRKYIARNWIRILVWSAYLAADWVATVALGNLASNTVDDSSFAQASNSIQSFWAPFLLLHLGGPDTITAYSLEDSELWLRHLLGLLVQVTVGVYVYMKSWTLTTSRLIVLAIPVYVSGIIKYGERTWVLRSSSTKQIKDSLRSAARTQEVNPLSGIPRDPPVGLENYLQQAYYLFKISIYLLEDLILGITDVRDNRKILNPRAKSSKDAFKLIEVELGFLYDTLYTKALLVYTRLGFILRSITLLSSVAAVVSFLIMDKHPYPTVDLSITYSLVIGALALEVYAVFYLISSDWTMIWLTKAHQNQPRGMSIIRNAVYVLHTRWSSGKRWSGFMGQYSLISSCLKIKPDTFMSKSLKMLRVEDRIKQSSVTWKEVSVDMKDLIFQHLAVRSDGIMVDENEYKIELRDKILDERGSDVLERNEQSMHKFKWTVTQAEFNQSLIIWHIATDLCFSYDINHGENKSDLGQDCKFSKCLSDYMMYLLVVSQDMLPFFHDVDYRYQQTCKEVEEFLKKKIWIGQGKKSSSSEREDQARITLLKEYAPPPPNDRDRFAKSALVHGCNLARQLNSLEISEKWKMTCQVWLQMMAYAASRCEGKVHAQQLKRGGELLTHVSLLMAHFGLSKQFEDKNAERVKRRDDLEQMDEAEI